MRWDADYIWDIIDNVIIVFLSAVLLLNLWDYYKLTVKFDELQEKYDNLINAQKVEEVTDGRRDD